MMTTILVSLIIASWTAVALTHVQADFFGETAESLEVIAIPVVDQATRQNYRG